MSAHSLATGPATAEPFISPLLLTITAALSSKYMKTPSFLLHVFLWRTITAGWTFFLSSGLPFLHEAMTKSPIDAEGNLFKRPLMPETAIISSAFAPVLSAQFTVAPTGRPGKQYRCCLESARETRDIKCHVKKLEIKQNHFLTQCNLELSSDSSSTSYNDKLQKSRM